MDTTVTTAGSVTPELTMQLLRPGEVSLSADGSRIAFAVSASFREKGKRIETRIEIAVTDLRRELAEASGKLIAALDAGKLEEANRLLAHVDTLRDQFTGKRRQSLQPHREDEPLHPVTEHLRWLEAAGFAAVDVPWRMLYTALLAAKR